LLVEIQALVVPTSAAQPRRSVKGLAASRVHQVVASIDRHGRIPMGSRDVYVSVMGGISIGEPAADLPMALAIASAVSDVPLRSVAAWGEVALTGEVRSVSQADRRRSESRRLGVEHIVEAGDGRSLHDVLCDVGVITGEMEHASGLRAIAISEGVQL
jgi:DNA repair protein RadA/Sms